MRQILCHAHFIPFPPNLEVLFSIFQKFFCPPPPRPGRAEQQGRQPPHGGAGRQQSGQHQPAEGQQIGPAAQQQGCRQIDADLPALPRQRGGKQQAGRRQPEQQVQQKGQPPPAEAAPQGPQQVVSQSQPGPQSGGPGKSQGLPRDVHMHGLPQQPGEEAAPSPPVLLVEDGVDASLHLQAAPVQ